MSLERLVQHVQSVQLGTQTVWMKLCQIKSTLIGIGAIDGAWHNDQYHLGQIQEQKIDV